MESPHCCVPWLSLCALFWPLTVLPAGGKGAVCSLAKVNDERKCFTLPGSRHIYYGVSVGNALSLGVIWHFCQCVRGEGRDWK